MNIFTISQSKRNDQIISQFFFFLYLFQNSARFKSNIILPICNNFFATYHFYNNLPTISFQMFNLFDLERSSIKDKSINFTTMLTKLPNIITLTLFTFRPVKTRKKKKIIIPNHPLSILVTYFTRSKGLISLTSFLSSLDALENEQNSNNDDREISFPQCNSVVYQNKP